jgi:hypothetical protein
MVDGHPMTGGMASRIHPKWLRWGHDCCGTATVSEHLPDYRAAYCLRRYLATPLRETILS